MYQNDWIMWQISLLVQFIARFIFGKDNVGYEITGRLEDEKTDLLYTEIMTMLAENKINQAENLLFERIETDNPNYIKIALDFYLKLNELSDEKLNAADYTRAEIEQGVRLIMKKFNIELPY